MLARATLMNTAQPMDIGALNWRKAKARARRVTRATARASREREAHEGKRMRKQTKMFSTSTAGRRDAEIVIVANEYEIRRVVRKLYASRL